MQQHRATPRWGRAHLGKSAGTICCFGTFLNGKYLQERLIVKMNVKVTEYNTDNGEYEHI